MRIFGIERLLIRKISDRDESMGKTKNRQEGGFLVK